MGYPEVICYGDLNADYIGRMDRIPEPDEELPIEDLSIHCGGAATNVAVGLSRLGHEVAFLGCAGSDPIADRMLGELRSEGVDLSRLIVKKHQMTGMVISILDHHGERRLMTHYGANAAMSEADLPEDLFATASIFHMSSPQLHMVRPLLERAKKNGLQTSFDPGSLICRHGMEVLGPLLPLVDLLFLNRVEYQQLVGDHEDLDFSLFFSKGCQTVIYKQGKEGSILVTREGVQFASQGFSVKPLDTTGAGDAFAAGYLSAMIRGLSATDRMRYANGTGALSVTARGAKEALPDRHQLESFLSQHSII